MELEREPLPLDSFPQNLRQHVEDDAPEKMKMMAAQGMVPAPPEQQIQLLYQLHFDDSMGDAVADSLTGMPPNVLNSAVGEDQPEGLLDWIAEAIDDPDVLETLILNDATADATHYKLATSSDGKLCEIIANNQVRVLRSPAIIAALYQNPEVGMATIDKLIELAQRNDVDLSEFPELHQATKAAELDEDDDGLDDETFEQLLDEEAGKKAEEQKLLDKLENEDLTRSEREKLQEELADATEDSEDAEETDDRSTREKIKDMSVGQKIRLATCGSREAIKLLVTDNNKLVHEAAISSPRIKLGDVKRLSSKKSLPDGVIEYIAKNREWTSDYEVMVNLVNNPKTPLSEATGFMKHLRINDLRKLTRNREVPHQVQRMAKRMMKRRRG